MEESPYIYRQEIVIHKEYNPKYGDERICTCGHHYYRHFDGYEDNRAVGCKYCRCDEFVERTRETPQVVLVPAELKPSQSLSRNCSIGGRYEAECPYCRETNICWLGEYAERKIDGTNKCPHFTNLTDTGEFLFKIEPVFELEKGFLIVDGVPLIYSTIGALSSMEEEEPNNYPSCLLENLEKMGAISSSSRGR